MVVEAGAQADVAIFEPGVAEACGAGGADMVGAPLKASAGLERQGGRGLVGESGLRKTKGQRPGGGEIPAGTQNWQHRVVALRIHIESEIPGERGTLPVPEAKRGWHAEARVPQAGGVGGKIGAEHQGGGPPGTKFFREPPGGAQGRAPQLQAIGQRDRPGGIEARVRMKNSGQPPELRGDRHRQ